MIIYIYIYIAVFVFVIDVYSLTFALTILN